MEKIANPDLVDVLGGVRRSIRRGRGQPVSSSVLAGTLANNPNGQGHLLHWETGKNQTKINNGGRATSSRVAAVLSKTTEWVWFAKYYEGGGGHTTFVMGSGLVWSEG